MKNVLCALFVVILSIVLCSCDNGQRYMKQDAVNLNYNNISAGASPYWIDNEFVCYTEHNFAFDLCTLDDRGKRRIAALSYSTDIQAYNQKVYYYDTNSFDEYSIIEYDLTSGKNTTIATIQTEIIYDIFVVHDCLYAVTGDNHTDNKTVVALSLATGTQSTVARNIFACGIANGKMLYITEEKDNFSVFEYNIENRNSNLLCSFQLALDKEFLVSEYVNFTSEAVILISTNCTVDESGIYIYNRKNDSMTSYSFQGSISQFVAYEKYAYFCADSIIDDTDLKQMIYRFNINEQSLEKITELKGYNDLFVGSDENVFISSTDFDGIRRYSVDGNFEDVIK